MSGGNRPFTLQDILGQLNQDAQQGASSSDSPFELNQFAPVSETVALTDAATLTTGPTSATWAQPITSSPSLLSSPSVISGATTGGFKWGTIPWS